jgi:hypothetical protein
MRARIFPHSEPTGRAESDKEISRGGSWPVSENWNSFHKSHPGKKKEASYELIDPT